MKKILYLFFALGLTLSACGTAGTQSVPPAPTFTTTLAPTETQISITLSSTLEQSLPIVLTATRLPNITPPPTQYFPPLLTPRVTPFPTRTRAEASEDLAYMLKTNGDCEFPCFWGIRPDITQYEELYSVIDNLGGYRFEALQLSGHLLIGSNFRFEDENRIQIEFQADVHDNIVRDLKVLLLNLWKTENTRKDWSAYNMNEILRTYGIPDMVELYYSGHYSSLSVHVQLKYESIDTSIAYYAGTTETTQYETPTSVIYCPEEIGINIVELHLGKKPFNTIPDGVPILKATGLNEQGFYKLFTDNPSACLTLNRKAFYP